MKTPTQEQPLPVSPPNYKLLQAIHHTDWVTHYRAMYLPEQKEVTLKLYASHMTTDDLFVRRLRYTTRQTAELEHPNILPLKAAQQAGDAIFVEQAYLPLRSLAEVMQADGPLSPARTRLIAGQIASALDYAHKKSVLHGDLSPRSIYLTTADRVLLADFGETQAIFGPNLTRQPYAIHSPETLAPERVRGQGPSRPADLYALGIITYQMLAQQPPFSGPASAVLHAQAHRQPQPLHEVNPATPLAVSEVIERMLAKSSELRYNTGAEFARAFNVACRQKSSFRRYDRLLPLTEREQPRSHPLRTLAFRSTLILALLLVALLSAWSGYEVGLQQTDRQATPSQIVIHTTLPTPTSSLYLQALRQQQQVQPAASPAVRKITALSESLLPPPSQLTPSPTATTLPTTLPPTPTVSPTATPAPANVSANQGRLRFTNPTGYDLIVDISGTGSTSALIPPGGQHEFLLPAGAYQYMVHTPTGQWLQSVVATFNLPAGQTIDKDYYSDYDWSRQ